MQVDFSRSAFEMSDSTTTEPTHTNILVPVDDSASSRAAFVHALKTSTQKHRLLLFHAHGESIYADCDGTILPWPEDKNEPDVSLEARHLRQCTEFGVCR